MIVGSRLPDGEGEAWVVAGATAATRPHHLRLGRGPRPRGAPAAGSTRCSPIVLVTKADRADAVRGAGPIAVRVDRQERPDRTAAVAGRAAAATTGIGCRRWCAASAPACRWPAPRRRAPRPMRTRRRGGAANSLRGTAGSYGFFRVSEAAGRLETRSRTRAARAPPARLPRGSAWTARSPTCSARPRPRRRSSRSSPSEHAHGGGHARAGGGRGQGVPRPGGRGWTAAAHRGRRREQRGGGAVAGPKRPFQRRDPRRPQHGQADAFGLPRELRALPGNEHLPSRSSRPTARCAHVWRRCTRAPRST